MIVKRPGSRPNTVEVSFIMPASIWADSIYLVGDFNGWSRGAQPLDLFEDAWKTTLELPNGRNYRFRYLIDQDHWCNDWGADANMPSPEGGSDSIVTV